MAKGVLKVAESQWGGKEAGRIGSSRVSVSVCVSFLVLGRQIKAPKDSLTHESCAAPGESQTPMISLDGVRIHLEGFACTVLIAPPERQRRKTVLWKEPGQGVN